MGKRPEVRAAELADWPMLERAYLRHYRPGTPLLDQSWWRWRFADPQHGRAFVAVAEGEVVAHLGFNRTPDVAWAMNLFIDPDRRGTGLAHALYDAARPLGTLATTNANRAGTDMYRHLRWQRLADLQRFVAWDPDHDPATIHEPVRAAPLGWPAARGHHYWEQPGLRGHVAPDGSTVVDNLQAGGLRVVELVDPVALADHAFAAGARWLDYVTSWNDPWCRELDRVGWEDDHDGPVAWLLDPLIPSSRARVNVFADTFLDPERIIRRWDCDHGRLGSRAMP